jgi:hypothetical protein
MMRIDVEMIREIRPFVQFVILFRLFTDNHLPMQLPRRIQRVAHGLGQKGFVEIVSW